MKYEILLGIVLVSLGFLLGRLGYIKETEQLKELNKYNCMGMQSKDSFILPFKTEPFTVETKFLNLRAVFVCNKSGLFRINKY